MKSFVALGLAAGAYAQSCCTFELTASGGQSGTVGQLSDGQIRIGGGLPQSSFTICNGTITDANGSACLLTPEIEQFQCDLNRTPLSGFSIAGNGTFEYAGSSTFYACPAADSEWNIYTKPVMGQDKCVEISLEASGCGAQATCPSAPASTVTSTILSTVTEVSTVTAEAVTVYQCPAITSAYVPVSTPVVETTPPVSVPESSVVIETPPPATYTPTTYSTPASESVSSVVTETPPPVSYTPTSYSTPASESQTPSSYTPTSETTSYPETSSSSIVVSTPYSYTPTGSVPLSTAPTTLYTSITTSYLWTNSSRTAPTSTTSAAATCVSTALTGTYTAGNYQFPHLIVPVSSTSPDTEYGTQYFGTISSNVSTIFNFDIPTSYAAKTCNLIFLLPLQSQLETSSYEFTGTGGVEFEQLSSPATASTTYNNVPAVSANLGDFTLTEGSSTLISSFACQAGQTVAYEAKAIGDTDLYYFQDYNPSPLGLYITVCE